MRNLQRWVYWAGLVVIVAIGIGVALLLSSRGRREPQQPSDVAVAEVWLQCIDCRGSFLERIRDTRPANRDSVVRLLTSALSQGPDSAHRARHERALVRTWYADSAYGAGRQDVLVTRYPLVLDRYRQGFEMMWRTRAATALGVLRTKGALAALDSVYRRLDSAGQGTGTLALVVKQAKDDSALTILKRFR
jgi:hypothetical protein